MKKSSKIAIIAASLLSVVEGVRLSPYLDGGGVPTVCYGDTTVTMRQYSVEECNDMLTQKTETVTSYVKSKVIVPLSDNQAAALVSFTYNIGYGAFAGSTLLRRLNSGCYTCVPVEMKRWVNIKGSYSQGLMNRRNQEIALWNKK